jgi:hypothetical protein
MYLKNAFAQYMFYCKVFSPYDRHILYDFGLSDSYLQEYIMSLLRKAGNADAGSAEYRWFESAGRDSGGSRERQAGKV